MSRTHIVNYYYWVDTTDGELFISSWEYYPPSSQYVGLYVIFIIEIYSS
jgi:hypothetical protein